MTKKIMFNDKYCLTQAVLDGTKTMTRRKFTLTLDKKVDGKLIRVYPSKVFFDNGKWLFDYDGKTYFLPKENYPAYKVGEVVAVAQSYKTIYDELESQGNWVANEWWCSAWDIVGGGLDTSAGYRNKMFVRADFMIHHIRITDVKVERLQDISDGDILKEGVFQFDELFYVSKNIGYAHEVAFPTAREAFWYLIDKVSGNGTWESNPWVVAYSFELVD
ncbi:MAG: hypothetical protein ACFN1F_01975 [Segatella sp.]